MDVHALFCVICPVNMKKKMMSKTAKIPRKEMTGSLLGQEVRRRKTPQEKIAIIQQTMEPGMNVSLVARLHGIQPSLLFKWKKQYLEGSLVAVAAGEEVVPASNRYRSYSFFWVRKRWRLRFSEKLWSTASRENG